MEDGGEPEKQEGHRTSREERHQRKHHCDYRVTSIRGVDEATWEMGTQGVALPGANATWGLEMALSLVQEGLRNRDQG